MEQGNKKEQGNRRNSGTRGTGEQEEGLRVRRCIGNRVLFCGPIC